MINIVMFENEKQHIKNFLKFPQMLYSKNENTEDRNNTKKIIMGQHIINKYCRLYKFIAYKDNTIVGRFVITKYPNDNIAYLGFYECIDENEIAIELFNKIFDFCKTNGFSEIIE